MNKSPRTIAALVLIFLVPAPSVGVLFGLWLAPGVAGHVIWSLSKVWLLAMPLVWHVVVDRRRPVFPKPHLAGLVPGLVSGIIIGALIIGGYYIFARRFIDPAVVRQRAAAAGFDSRSVYLAIVVYSAFVNALLEEYVWRWFVFTKLQQLIAGRSGLIDSGGAVVLAAAFFTLHHIVALAAYFGPQVTALGLLGVFVGGVTWSALYLRYRSIYPGYVSHIIADLAVFGVGYILLFR
jgi:CAAX protease family protein